MEETTAKKKSGNREFVGLVTSDKMDKTIVVQVATKKLHRLYKKYVLNTKKYKAHDEQNTAHNRPISKEKCWRLAEIIERAK